MNELPNAVSSEPLIADFKAIIPEKKAWLKASAYQGLAALRFIKRHPFGWLVVSHC